MTIWSCSRTRDESEEGIFTREIRSSISMIKIGNRISMIFTSRRIGDRHSDRTWRFSTNLRKDFQKQKSSFFLKNFPRSKICRPYWTTIWLRRLSITRSRNFKLRNLLRFLPKIFLVQSLKFRPDFQKNLKSNQIICYCNKKSNFYTSNLKSI